MLIVALACASMLAMTTLIHFEILSTLNRWLPAIPLPSRFKLLVVIGSTFLAHLVEIALYALALVLLVHFGAGRMSGGGTFSLNSALYFSAETYTSLGYGDFVPAGSLRMLAGSEALNGLLLIGWSASYIYIAMERFWVPGSIDRSSERSALRALWRRARSR